MSTDEELIEALKEDAKFSYGENRLDAIDTLATFGEDALPALVELLEFYTETDAQQHVREYIREIKGNRED